MADDPDAAPFSSWGQLVRHLARSWPIHMLHPSIQRAAERDPTLEWDAPRNCYRRRRIAPPAPPLATDDAAEGEGASNVPDTQRSRPAAAANFNDGALSTRIFDDD